MNSFTKNISVLAFSAAFTLWLSPNIVKAQENVRKQISSFWSSSYPPVWWIEFCEREKKYFEIPPAFRKYIDPNEKVFDDNLKMCISQRLKQKKIKLTEESWKKIVHINAEVNKVVSPLTDEENYWIHEYWWYPKNWKWDCEDYVLEKRKRLILEWFPEQALLITVVKDKSWDWHAVLTIKTDRWDFILDNAEGKILAWDETDYTYIKRQSDTNMMEWISLWEARWVRKKWSL